MAQQEGVEVLRKEYFDIMLVGMTGQGKSTMADKLLIANPGNVSYALPDKLNMRQSMWLLHEGDEKDVETDLKGLVYSRTKSKSHDEVNSLRDPRKNILASTGFCQVFSNDTTKVRILDVHEKAFSSTCSVQSTKQA